MSSRRSEEVNEVLEPQVTSLDPNERKLARRLRIERRLEALKGSKCVRTETELCEAEETDQIKIQIKKSAEFLEQFLIEGEEYITNVRIANESREVDRRENEGINKENIFQQLDEEAQSANELFDTIASKWTSIQRQNDPLQINESIMEQKEKCDMLISQKDGIISMLNEELRKAERQFTKDQKKQMEDINTLSQRIEKQISFMRRAYREELNILENVIQHEREVLIELRDKKWEELFRKRENQEVSNTNKKFEQVEEFNRRMEALRINFQEHFRETKIKLENDIEELQRELEKIKDLALLNSEKLDYNYQILKKREDENIIIKSQQKRRMNKLQDVINDLRRQISDYESNMGNKIKKLSDNIRKLHKSIVDVEAKADHFAHVNDEKFHMVWEMNKTKALEVLEKILDTDRVLYEQQMGLDWEPPTNFITDKRTLPSYKLAITNVSPEFLHEVYSLDNKASSTKSTGSQGLSSIQDCVEALDEAANANYMQLLKHILIRISDKSGFLAEKRLKDLLRGYTDDQKDIVRLDNVFAALGIQGASYINILLKHFYPYTYCPVCQGSLVIQAFKSDSKSSAASQVSSIFSRIGESSNLYIEELNNVINAIKQPDEILTSIVTQLVNVDNISQEPDTVSEMSDMETIENVCGVAGENQYYTDTKTKDKVKVIACKRKTSVSKFCDFSLCAYRHPLVISPVYVLRALREFVASYYIQTVGLPTTGARLEKKRITISRYLSENDIKLYWEKFKMNFGEDRVRVWNGLMAGLRKYHEILKDRRTICDEVLKLRNENAELKRLLGNYLDHHDLMEPPCANERYSP